MSNWPNWKDWSLSGKTSWHPNPTPPNPWAVLSVFVLQVWHFSLSDGHLWDQVELSVPQRHPEWPHADTPVNSTGGRFYLHAPNQILDSLSRHALINGTRRADPMTTKGGLEFSSGSSLQESEQVEGRKGKKSHLWWSAGFCGTWTNFKEITVYFPSLLRSCNSPLPLWRSPGILHALGAIVWAFKLTSESEGYCNINY